MYHSISDDDYFLSVKKINFDRQLNLLYKLGYKSVFFNEINFNTKQKQFVITFDDGYLDNYSNALPILKKYNYKAICFVVSNLIGTHNAWDKNHIKYEQKDLMNENHIIYWLNEGNKIGSHTLNHKNLTKLSKDELFSEITNSKNHLEEKFSIPVDTFSYPYGAHDLLSKSIAKKAYNYIVTTSRSRHNSSFDWSEIPRVPINSNTKLLSFFAKLFTPYEDIKFKK